MKIDELDFTVRTYNALKRGGINTVEELKNMSDVDLMNIRNFGSRCLAEVHEKLGKPDGADNSSVSAAINHLGVKEKLIRILSVPLEPNTGVSAVESVANYLMDNGVTIHGWIPVTEGMPEEHQSVVPGLGMVSRPVLVTWLDPTSDKPYPDNCFVREGITRNGEFTLHHINGDLVPVAWMPQPSPYKQPPEVAK